MHVVLSVHHLRKTLFPGQIFGYEPHIATRITLVLHWTFEMLTGQAIALAAQAGDRSRSARLALENTVSPAKVVVGCLSFNVAAPMRGERNIEPGPVVPILPSRSV